MDYGLGFRVRKVDCNPPSKSQLTQRKLTFGPFLLQLWSRTTRILGAVGTLLTLRAFAFLWIMDQDFGI